jgi:hypothetical protein
MSDQTKPKSKSVTQRLLAFIKGSPTMARGKITEEYREGAIGADGTPAKLGPYYKIQGRCHGEHFTGRVAKGEVDLVKGQISNLDTFLQLTEAVVDEAVARGEQERSGLAKSIDESQSAQKKTSSRRVRMSGSRKPTPS